MDIRGFWRCGLFDPLGCCKFDNGYDAFQLIDALIELLLAGSEARTIKRCTDRAALLSVKDISLNNNKQTSLDKNNYNNNKNKHISTTPILI